MYTIYHNPRCRKSREALAWVEGTSEEVVIINYLKTPPSIEELTLVLTKLDMRPQEIIRKNESLFKDMYKGKVFSDNQWVQILVDNPILIERPIVIKGQRAVLGRPTANVIALL